MNDNVFERVTTTHVTMLLNNQQQYHRNTISTTTHPDNHNTPLFLFFIFKSTEQKEHFPSAHTPRTPSRHKQLDLTQAPPIAHLIQCPIAGASFPPSVKWGKITNSPVAPRPWPEMGPSGQAAMGSNGSWGFALLRSKPCELVGITHPSM